MWDVQFATGEPNSKPLVKLVANLQGNELAGREILIQFAEYLCDDPAGKAFLDQAEIHVLPSLNPDGSVV